MNDVPALLAMFGVGFVLGAWWVWRIANRAIDDVEADVKPAPVSFPRYESLADLDRPPSGIDFARVGSVVSIEREWRDENGYLRGTTGTAGKVIAEWTRPDGPARPSDPV